ncbi:MAG TPA: ROK family protein, partial [Planctomycetota bacterium]|nr:ROK family protein [Planctomycetota bacterium]
PREAPGDLALLARRAREGGAEEAALLEAVGLDLGHFLAVVVSLLDLRCFVFGGGFSAALDTLDVGLRRGIDERCYGSRSGTIRLLRASLGPSAGWIGAARRPAGAR